MNDVFDIFADVAGFGQCRRIRDREWHVEESCQRLGQQSFAAARWADQQDVALGELDIVLGALVEPVMEALVVVVHRDRQHFLGLLLANHVLVENFLDFLRLGQLVVPGLAGVLKLFANNIVTELNAFVTDKDGWTRNQLADFMLALAAKRTIEEFAVLVLTAGIIAHVQVASVTTKSIAYDC